jgi:uncharacterized protein (TIGR00255 family)
MTGFGSSKLGSADVILNVQVKSVNGRFLESRFKLPREYAAFETELKKTLSKSITRGTVDIFVHREVLTSSNASEVKPNIALARAWLTASQTLAKELKLSDSNLSLEAIMKLPEVVSLSNSLDSVSDNEKNQLFTVFGEAVKACVHEKKREGEEQFKVLNALLDQVFAFVKLVESQIEVLNKKLSGKLHERLKALVPSGEVAIDPSRLAQEVLFLTEKADVSEEIERAKAHVIAFKELLKDGASMGKKLEFYTQELHRELNTMGSKIQNVDLTLSVVDAKAVIERLREQVQNVE